MAQHPAVETQGAARKNGKGTQRASGENPVILIALDPSSEINGYGLLSWDGKEPVLLQHGTIRLKKGRPIERRLFDLRQETESILSLKGAVVTHFAIERAFGGRFPAATLALGRLDGVLRELCWEITGKPAITLAANEVRRIIGSKTKATTKKIVEERFGIDLTGEPYDTSDAIALGWAALSRAKM
jgi:crossover junction endodeoxyribonuclease RuvC